MRIWQKLLTGFLVIIALVMLFASVSIYLSMQVGKLREIELPMEQDLREVEVSIWEAIHAANAYRTTGDPYYSKLYEIQVKDVEKHLSTFRTRIETPNEVGFANKFEYYWNQSRSEGSKLLEIVQLEKVAEDEFFYFVDRADDVIDFKIQARLSHSDQKLIEKEQALREVEVSIWESIHAAAQYTGLTQNIGRAGHAQSTFAKLMQHQFGDVDEYWSQYKVEATTDDERVAIREFEDLWRHAADAGKKVVSLHDQASQSFANLYEQIGLADDVIDFEMQSHIEKRIHNRDESATKALFWTIALGLIAVIGAAVTCIIIARSLSAPITSLMRAVDEFGQGNLEHRVASNRKDELGDLSRAFDQMGDELKRASEQLTCEVAERKQAEESVREAREYLEAALTQSPSAIVIADAPDGKIRLANQAAFDIRGGDKSLLTDIDVSKYSENWQLYRPDGSPYPPEQLPLSLALFQGKTVREQEMIIRDVDGNDHWITANAAPIRDAEGEIASGIVVFHDISELRQTIEQMQELAFHDPLTGLPNRASILESIQAVIDRADGKHVALLFLDFDRFKLINDSLGHDVGDELLKEIANRLRSALRAADGVMIPARLGGDEFVVLLENLSSSADAIIVAERIQATLSQPYELCGKTIYSGASIGVVTSEHRSESACEMLRDADLAMYKAKAEGNSSYAVFDQVLREVVQTRLGIENEMRDGISRNEFALVYQPLVSLETGQIEGAEALLRWYHPNRGMVGADEFIPIAEETRMIIPIGNKIIDEACREVAKWNRSLTANDRPRCVHVNISRVQLSSPSLVTVVERALTEHAVPPECLHLEVTETAIMDDPKAAVATLGELRRLGVKIDMDDFGQGYSSLSCIREFPIDVLKIDRVFIANVTEDSDSTALLNAVLTLADHLELQVVAEGIENVEQLALLRELGCKYGQGFLFAEAMHSNDFERLLESTPKWSPDELKRQSTSIPMTIAPGESNASDTCNL